MLLKTPHWRQTPPAIFPVTLGFMGLGLAWRNAADVLPLPREIGDLLLGVSTPFFLFFLVFYLAKLAARPAVLLDDVKAPPARAGIAALAMSMMLLAAVLLPFNIGVSQVWWTGVILQILASIVVVYAMWKDPPKSRQFTPFQYLTFVGLIVGPVAGIPLGYVTESYILAYLSMASFVIITLGYGRKLIQVRPPVPLRPTLVIVLAPISLFALCFGQLHVDLLFTLFYWATWPVALVLLALGLWLTKGGWTPVWGAFTFPIATFTNVQVMGVTKGYGAFASAGIYAGLVVGTPLILYIVYRATKAWTTGELARKSGAATA